MSAYAILRFQKRKKGSIAKVGNHHERTKQFYKSNPDIDMSRAHLNYHIKQPKMTYTKEIKKRIEQAGCRTRKDSVLMIDTLITASPEYMNKLSEKGQRNFFVRACNFIAGQVGAKNIISAVVHMDEATPHMHLTFTPITKDNRLTAKEIIGNAEKLTKWQDDFYAYMVENFPQLERGKLSKETGRNHIPVWLFKQSKRLNKQVEQIRAELGDMGILNVGTKKKDVLKLLEKFYPQANRFDEAVKEVLDENRAIQAKNAELDDRNRELGAELSAKRLEVAQEQANCANLENTYNDLLHFLNHEISEDMLNELKELRGQAKGAKKAKSNANDERG